MAIPPLPALAQAAVPALPVAPPQPPAVPPAGSSAGGSAAGDAADRREPAQDPAPGGLDKALREVNQSMEAWSTSLHFEVDPDAQRLVVSVLDARTGEVLRTIPSEAVIRVAKMIVNLQGRGVATRA